MLLLLAAVQIAELCFGKWSVNIGDVTRLLEAIAERVQAASAELLPLNYAELRRPAASKIANEKPGQTLHATALVHEDYLRLVGSGASDKWAGRGHFFSARPRPCAAL